MKRIPLLIPDMPRADDLIGLLREIDGHRWYTNFGPLANRFEAQLAGRFQERGPVGVVSLCNCTLALELLISACRLPAGSTILVPALTFVATGTAIRRAGHRLLVADVDPQRWTLTPEPSATRPRDAALRLRSACTRPRPWAWGKAGSRSAAIRTGSSGCVASPTSASIPPISKSAKRAPTPS